MQNFDLENIKSHPSLSLAKAKASRDLQINFNQAEDPLTISTKSRGDNKCGSATQSGRSLIPESGADAPTVLSTVYTDSTPAKNRQADAPQYGRSMIEMLGVLAIIGVLSVGGIAGYSKAMQKYRINKTIEQITLIAGNVRAFFAPQKSYDGFYINPGCGGNCEVVHKAKLVPEEMMELNSEGKLKSVINEFGRYVWGNSTGKNSSTDKQAFYLQFDGIKEACIELLSQDWTNAGVRAIGTFYHGSSKYYQTPVSVDDAVTYCSIFNDTSGGLYFYFDIDVNSTYWQGIINPSS